MIKSLDKKENLFDDFFFNKFQQTKDYERLIYYLNEDFKVY